VARVAPLLDTDPAGGMVVVTRFNCHNLASLLALRVLHIRLKHDVRRHAKGFIGVKTLILWHSHTLLSISLWQDLDSVYSMGNVPRHVSAVRRTGALASETACGVFCYTGDWRRVMFRTSSTKSSPFNLSRTSKGNGNGHPD
jgi:hypothetical protein